MAPLGAKKGEDKGVAEVVSDLWQLVRDYAKQETIDPLKSLGRFLGWGIAGALVLSLGLVFLSLGVLRLLQTQTGEHLTGSFTWVPYLAALVIDTVAIGLTALRIKKPFSSEEKGA